MDPQLTQLQQPVISPQFSPSPTPPPSKPGLKLRMFLLLGMVLVGLIIAGYYLTASKTKSQLTLAPVGAESSPIQSLLSPTQQLTPTLNPTISWKTYLNSEFGYSVKYPNALVPKDLSNDIYLNFISFGNSENKNELWFTITVRETSLEQETEFIKWQLGHSLVKLKKENDLKILNHFARRLEYVSSDENQRLTSFILINKGKYTYTIESRPEYIDQILSTFTFLDQEITENNTDWKTYKDEMTGFLIKYPNKYSPKPRISGVSLLLPFGNKEIEKIIIEKNFAGGWACTQTVSSEEIIIDGNKGKLEIHATTTPDENCSKIDPNGSRFSTVVITHKEVIWFFHYQIEKLQETEEIVEFKNILSTFKFLE